jgi:hypothetical protein
MTLTVPNERDDAATVQLDLRFPEGQTLTNVTAAATPGWTATVDPNGIVWKGGPLTGENEVALQFTATLPAGVDRLEFRALQTYDNGDIVRWIESTPEGGPEPEHPAPVLTVGAAATPPDQHEETSDTTAAGNGSAADDHSESAASTSKDDDSDAAPVIIAIVAVVAVLAAGGGTLIYLRRRRAAS